MVILAEGVAGVQDVSVAARAGVERAVVLAWEQRHNVIMPQALRSLYMATDGFKLTWNYSTAGICWGLLAFPFFLPFVIFQSFRHALAQCDLAFIHVMLCCFLYSGKGGLTGYFRFVTRKKQMVIYVIFALVLGKGRYV